MWLVSILSSLRFIVLRFRVLVDHRSHRVSLASRV